jgi:hypothetical protein
MGGCCRFCVTEKDTAKWCPFLLYGMRVRLACAPQPDTPFTIHANGESTGQMERKYGCIALIISDLRHVHKLLDRR